MTKTLPAELPKPDQYGNYWLGGRPSGPCIMKGGDKAHVAGADGDPRWFASLGDLIKEFGILLLDDTIWYFDTPEKALMALRSAWSRA